MPLAANYGWEKLRPPSVTEENSIKAPYQDWLKKGGKIATYCPSRFPVLFSLVLFPNSIDDSSSQTDTH